MKKEFIDFLEALMAAAPQVEMTENVRLYIDKLKNDEVVKSELTDNGKMILKHMQGSDNVMFKSRDIAEDLFISSRSVSGALRKLVTDGFCEKMGQDPVIYSLTEKGKNFIID